MKFNFFFVKDTAYTKIFASFRMFTYDKFSFSFSCPRSFTKPNITRDFVYVTRAFDAIVDIFLIQFDIIAFPIFSDASTQLNTL